jgi:hypothetical protein
MTTAEGLKLIGIHSLRLIAGVTPQYQKILERDYMLITYNMLKRWKKLFSKKSFEFLQTRIKECQKTCNNMDLPKKIFVGNGSGH